MKKYFFQALIGVLGLVFWVYAFQPTPDSVSASPPLGITPTVTSGPTSTPVSSDDDDDDDDSSHSLAVTLECANNLTCPIGPQTIDVAIPVQLIPYWLRLDCGYYDFKYWCHPIASSLWG